MGRLMDKVMGAVVPSDPTAPDRVRESLSMIAPYCHWTSGVWSVLHDLPWNALENTSRHTRMLSNLLVRVYVSTRGSLA